MNTAARIELVFLCCAPDVSGTSGTSATARRHVRDADAAAAKSPPLRYERIFLQTKWRESAVSATKSIRRRARNWPGLRQNRRTRGGSRIDQ